jgi:Ca2+-binding RTX toxin-like protein
VTGTGCTQAGPTAATCVPAGLNTIEIRTGTGADEIAFESMEPGAVGAAYAGGGRDRLIGNSNGASGNQLHGGGGADRIIGRGGNDALYGEAGGDRLKGGPGRDYFAGGRGSE